MDKKQTIWNLINRVIWSRNKESYEIVVIDRLTVKGEKTINGACIKGLLRGFIIISCNNLEETMIPLHRVIEIRRKDKTIWSRR